MFKKIMLASVISVSTLSIMTANAAVVGPYITGQLGNANTHMSSKVGLSNNGLAGRLAGGYQFSPNLALEVGYLQLNGKKADFNKAVDVPSLSLKLNQQAIDVAARGSYNVADNISLGVKLGVARLHTSVKATNTSSGENDKITKNQWAPEVGVDAVYQVNPNMSLNASLTHINSTSKQIGNIDFLALGLGYSFG